MHEKSVELLNKAVADELFAVHDSDGSATTQWTVQSQ